MNSPIQKTCVAWLLCTGIHFAGLAMTSTTHAGPLLDWMRERCGRNTNQQQGLLATSGSFTHAPTTLMPGQCQQTCLQTCQRTTVNYVPYTDYRTTWQRVPVTQYRPVTSTDPTTGCTTTCMRPCTDYKWQLQRIPYTTYRPVYQTQNYQVPVTTITSDGGMAGGCQTCSVPNAGYSAGPSGGFYTNPTVYPGGTGNSAPADNIPILGSQMQSIPDPYAQPRMGQSRMESYRPTFPASGSPGNPYANPNAYSGMSSYSGYQAPVRRPAPPVYYPPIPSGFTAPLPEFDAPSSRQQPADRVRILEDFEQPSSSSQLQKRPVVDAWQDPNPSLRWEYNTPPSGHPADQSVHRDVQQKWDYNPVRLVSHSEVSDTDLRSRTFASSPSVNDAWTSSESPVSGYNSDWN